MASQIDITMTKIYGISFMADVEHTKEINDRLVKQGLDIRYLPEKFRMNIYFNDCIEAFKVAEFLNNKHNGRHYSVFPTSLQTLEKFKNYFENNKKLQKKNPSFYHRVTGYRIFDTAEDYLARLQKNETATGQNFEEKSFN